LPGVEAAPAQRARDHDAVEARDVGSRPLGGGVGAHMAACTAKPSSTGLQPATPGGSSPTRSRGCPEVRITGRRGQRIFTARARSMHPRRSWRPHARRSAVLPRRLRAFALDSVHFLVLEQRRRQAAKFGVVLDDQYGSPFVLRLPHDQVRWSNCTLSVFSNRLRQSGALKNKRDACRRSAARCCR
jgi:hypothetical protein